MRGDAGCAHLQCLVEVAERDRDPAERSLHCPMCLQPYVGTVGVELARAWWRRVRDTDEPERHLETYLRNALFGSGEFEAGSRLRGSESKIGNTSRELLSRVQFHIKAGRHREAIEAADSVTGLDPFETHVILPKLKARALMELGRGDEAEELMRTCVRYITMIWGPNSRPELLGKHFHAQTLIRAGRLDESRRMLRELLPIQTKILGRDHPETRATACQLAALE